MINKREVADDGDDCIIDDDDQEGNALPTEDNCLSQATKRDNLYFAERSLSMKKGHGSPSEVELAPMEEESQIPLPKEVHTHY